MSERNWVICVIAMRERGEQQVSSDEITDAGLSVEPRQNKHRRMGSVVCGLEDL